MTGDAPEADKNDPLDPHETLPLAAASDDEAGPKHAAGPAAPVPPPPPPPGTTVGGDSAPPPPPPPGFPPPAPVEPGASVEPADPTLVEPVAGQAPPPAEERPVEPVAAPDEPPPATAVVPVADPVPADPAAAPPSGKRGQRASRPPKPGLPAAVVALAVGLLASAVVQSAVRARSDGDIDWSNYSVGLAATAALLLTAIGAIIAIRSTRNPVGREELVTWPGVLGILGAAVMIGVALDTADQRENAAYVIGGVVVVLGLVGYAIIMRPAFMVTVVLGLVILYGRVFDEVADDLGDEDTGVMVAVGAIAVFVLVVTLLGWLLPSRAVTGVAVGVGAVVAFTSVLGYLAAVQAIDRFFGEMAFPTDPTATPPGEPTPLGSDSMMGYGFGAQVDDEVWTVLGVSGLLMVIWAFAAARTGHSGFTILTVVLPVAVVPLATFVLAVDSPTWWAATVAGGGGVMLLAIAVQQTFVRRDLTEAA